MKCLTRTLNQLQMLTNNSKLMMKSKSQSQKPNSQSIQLLMIKLKPQHKIATIRRNQKLKQLPKKMLL